MASSSVDPLREYLEAVTQRLAALEAHCGFASTTTTPTTPSPAAKSADDDDDSSSPAIEAFDKYNSTTVSKCAAACNELGMGDDTGKLLTNLFDGMRHVVLLASKSKKPSSDAELAEHLKAMTEPMGEIRKLRLSRDFDNHYKAICEMMACCSWVTQQLPVPFVKECVGSSDYWSNRIRKEFRGRDDEKARLNVAFCDNLKAVILDLSEYITEHHKTGLTFDPKGGSLAETASRLKEAAPPKKKTNGAVAAAAAANGKKDQPAGNTAGLFSELANRRSQDGSSAATGLKKVTKDQQTWRKEFKADGEKKVVVAASTPVAPKSGLVKKKKGLPVLEYQPLRNKWIIENHDKTTAKAHSENGLLEVEISDPKQQVYVYNCEEVTIKINGTKFKSIIVDKCKKVNVIFPTIISGCEIVNSEKIAVQSNGVCPVFTIDKTLGVSVYLSKESANVSSFTTSMSSEMNVSIPDGDDYKEIPIPEQFFHKFTDSGLTSEVSELYR